MPTHGVCRASNIVSTAENLFVHVKAGSHQHEWSTQIFSAISDQCIKHRGWIKIQFHSLTVDGIIKAEKH